MISLNVIEQAQFNRRIASLYERIQTAEGYFSGIEISTARIKDASITTAKIVDGAIDSAKIANATIQDAKINDVVASKLTSGYISADRIASNSITVDKLNVSSLSAISADLGSITAGTITGATVTGSTIRTAASGTRVELTQSDNSFSVYDGALRRVRLYANFLIFAGDNSIRLYNGNTIIGQISASSSSFNFVSTEDADAAIDINAWNETDTYIQASGIINLIAPDIVINTYKKTAIVPTSKGYKAVYCAEAPEVWFMDFYKNKIDKMFDEVTTGKSFEFDCINGQKLILRKRKGFENVRFERKTSVELERNNKLYAA